MQRAPQSTDARPVIEAINKYYRNESENRLTDMISIEQKSLDKLTNTMIATVGVYVHPW